MGENCGRRLEVPDAATLSRNGHARTASRRLLTATTTTRLPPATRTRPNEEWPGELHTLPARRSRAPSAVDTLPGAPRMGVTLHGPARRNRWARW